MKTLAALLLSLGVVTLPAQETQSLKGVLIVDDNSKLRTTDLNQIAGIQFDGIQNEALSEELTPLLSSLPLSSNGAEELCKTITAHYRDADGLRVSVSLPDQTMADGVVQLVVSPEKLGEINVKSNRYTSPETLKKWIRLSPKTAINEKTLAQDVAWINTNPYHKVKVAYQPGSNPGLTDIDLIVSDNKAWKMVSGVDNTGTLPIGPLRIYAGININDFIFTDHILDLKATTANYYSEYQSYAANYTAPLPWRSTLKLGGSYTQTSPINANYPQKHRQSYKATARYIAPQWLSSNVLVDQIKWESGFDFKGTNTNIFFENQAAPVEKKLAYIGQFVAGLQTERSRPDSKIIAQFHVIGSPARMLSNQTDADYENLRNGADPIYAYSKATISLDQNLPKSWKLLLKGRGQFSVSNLIPSEQFGLGGYSTIRGYDERAVTGDNALLANFELKTPSVAPVGLWIPKFKDSLTLLGFVDAGYAWYRQEVTGKPLDQGLVGVGTGVRYSVSSYLTSRIDVGFPLIEVQKSKDGPHVHFNAVFSF